MNASPPHNRLHAMKSVEQALQGEIFVIEMRLADMRKKTRDAARSAWVDETPEVETAASSGAGALRERRLQSRLTRPSTLEVDLDAESTTQHLQVDTAFYSPSWHDWKQDKILTSRDWTPFTSPRRGSASSASTKKWPTVLLGTEANRRPAPAASHAG